MATKGAQFLYSFSVGAYLANTPGTNVVSVTSTATGDFSKTNLTTTPLKQTWRSTSTATQTIIIQANDTTAAPDIFAILGHNLTSSAVVRVFASANLVFSATPVFTFTYNKKHLIYNTAMSQAWNYYKIIIQDAGNPYGYIELGRIVAGASMSFTQNEDLVDDFSVSREDMSYQMNTEGFSRASNERVRIDTISPVFDHISTATGSNTNYTNFQTFVDYVGTALPFLFILDPNDVYFKFAWGQFVKMPSEAHTLNRLVQLTMDIQEVY